MTRGEREEGSSDLQRSVPSFLAETSRDKKMGKHDERATFIGREDEENNLMLLEALNVRAISSNT
jgi:hypothetical protein